MGHDDESKEFVRAKRTVVQMVGWQWQRGTADRA